MSTRVIYEYYVMISAVFVSVSLWVVNKQK